MALNQPMLHEKKEELLLQKIRQRHREFGDLRFRPRRTIENIRIRETTAYEKIEGALNAGDWRAGETVRRAYELNVPMVAWTSAKAASSKALISVDAPNVIIETVKKADREDALIVRMYECAGMDAKLALRTGFGISKATECDLLERDLKSLKHGKDSVPLSLKPFELKTVKLIL